MQPIEVLTYCNFKVVSLWLSDGNFMINFHDAVVFIIYSLELSRRLDFARLCTRTQEHGDLESQQLKASDIQEINQNSCCCNIHKNLLLLHQKLQ